MSSGLNTSTILRYWLGMIRREEALGARISASPLRNANRPVDLVEPGRGQSYFKLRGEAAEFLLRETTAIQADLTGDRLGFFEHWLRETYRRERFRNSDQDEVPPLLVGFPVFHDARRGELNTLFRFSIEPVDWLGQLEQAWAVPARRKRVKGPGLAGPAGLMLSAEPPDEDAPAASVNEVVLGRILGVTEERIGAFSRLLAQQDGLPIRPLIRWVEALVSGAAEDEVPPPPNVNDYDADDDLSALEVLQRLTQTVSERIVANNHRVWPVGLCWDGATLKATHYLQQDLRELIREDVRLRPTSPLTGYLSGKPGRTGRRAWFGHREDRQPTRSQRAAGESFLGSRLTAVQGPPGTGKTEMILALCGHALIERMARGTGGTEPPLLPSSPSLMVCSTNNRAVDNVVDPLSLHLGEGRLPLALRVGSRPVVREVTVASLRTAAGWLERADPTGAREVYDTAREQLLAAVKTIQKAEDAWLLAGTSGHDVAAAEARVASLRLSLDEVNAVVADLGISGAEAVARREAATKALTAIGAFQKALVNDLSRIDAAREEEKPASARKAWKRVNRRAKRLETALTAAGLRLMMPPSPEDKKDLGSWIETLDRVIERIDLLEELAADVEDSLAAARDPTTIVAELAVAEEALTDAQSRVCDPAELRAAVDAAVEEHEAGLLDTALRMREAWAVLNRTRLLKSVKRVARQLEDMPSIKSARRQVRTALDDVEQLFPIWGCTLLSLGNAWPMEPGSLQRVVIDEAGQCHPAYAVSALYRADRALVIGDVNQLEPVVGLDEAEEGRVLRRLGLYDWAEALQPFRATTTHPGSVQALTERATQSVPTLHEHFRCQPEIIKVCDDLCDYDLDVRTPPASLGDQCALLSAPLLGVDVRGDQSASAGSWANAAEVGRIVALVRRMLADGISSDRIAVLTPYRGQLRALTMALKTAGVQTDDGERLDAQPQVDLFGHRPSRGVALGTVHRFQGGERDVVVFSTVVSQPRSLVFTNARLNLVNVAVSRARMHLVVVGNRELLAQGRVTRTLIDAVPNSGWLT
ncbi:MAG: hypothetical protein ACI9WU_000705 [Myxococcota bacterium]|jgi:hypothetical protein